MRIQVNSNQAVGMKSLIYKLILAAACLVVSTPAFAVPVVDGFKSVNEYSNPFTAGWYNGHKEEFSQFKKVDDHETTVYWESTGTSTTDGNFYLYIEAPLEAKNMIWGTGVTVDEANMYFVQWDTHHNLRSGETVEDDFRLKLDFKKMTDSEKVVFGGGIEVDLDGDVKAGTLPSFLQLQEHKDSVDYVIDFLGFDNVNSSASDIPMAFEFKFDFLTSSEISTLIGNIQDKELAFHLSPERGGTVSQPVPEPSTIALLGIGLAGLAGAAVRRRLKKTKQAITL